MSDKVLGNKKISDALIAVLVLLLPLLRYFDIPMTTISFVPALTIVLILLYLFKALNNHSKNDGFRRGRFFLFLFILYFIFSNWANYLFAGGKGGFSTNSIFTYIVPVLLMVCLLLASRSSLDSVLFLKIFQLFIFVLTAVYLIQWPLFLVGHTFSFKIPFFQFSDSWKALNNYDFGFWPKPTSLFSERAHLSEYFLPYICVCLFSDRFGKYSRIKGIIASLVVVSTVSGNGVIGVALLWLFYMLFGIKVSKPKRVCLLIAAIAFLFVAYLALMQIESFNAMFSELFVKNGDATRSKASYRIYRGIDYFFRMPLNYKFFGVGYKQMEYMSASLGIHSTYDSLWETNFEYFSSVGQLLLYFGLLGTFFYLGYLVNLFKRASLPGRAILAIYIAFSFSSSILFSETHILYEICILMLVNTFSLKERGRSYGRTAIGYNCMPGVQ